MDKKLNQKLQSNLNITMRAIFFLLLLVPFSFAKILQKNEAVIIKNEMPAFEITLPADFKELARKEHSPLLLYAFVQETIPKTPLPITVTIQSLWNLLKKPHKLDLKTVKKSSPKGALVQIINVEALGFKLEAVRSLISIQGKDVVAYAVQVPVKPEAIQIVVGGGVEKETEIKSILDAMLGSIKAETNWLTAKQAGKKLSVGLGRLITVVFLILIIAVCFLYQKNKKHR